MAFEGVDPLRQNRIGGEIHAQGRGGFREGTPDHHQQGLREPIDVDGFSLYDYDYELEIYHVPE